MSPAEITKTYTSPEGTRVDISFQNDAFWLTQAQIADVFAISSQQVAQHLHTIYNDRELSSQETGKNFIYFDTAQGKTSQKQAKFFNHDAAISVGYRIHNVKATHFRLWVNLKLKEIWSQSHELTPNTTTEIASSDIPKAFEI